MTEQGVARRGCGSRTDVMAITGSLFGKLNWSMGLHKTPEPQDIVSKLQQNELVMLYDGVCGLCNRSVHFVLRHDHNDRFRFASLQSDFATNVLRGRGHKNEPDSVYLLARGNGCDAILVKSDAAIRVLRELGGVWVFVAATLKVVPQRLRDWGYDLIARNRYRWFGRYETCPMPSEKDRRKFLDQ